jgi:hypothetical protein
MFEHRIVLIHPITYICEVMILPGYLSLHPENTQLLYIRP